MISASRTYTAGNVSVTYTATGPDADARLAELCRHRDHTEFLRDALGDIVQGNGDVKTVATCALAATSDDAIILESHTPLQCPRDPVCLPGQCCRRLRCPEVSF